MTLSGIRRQSFRNTLAICLRDAQCARTWYLFRFERILFPHPNPSPEGRRAFHPSPSGTREHLQRSRGAGGEGKILQNPQEPEQLPHMVISKLIWKSSGASFIETYQYFISKSAHYWQLSNNHYPASSIWPQLHWLYVPANSHSRRERGTNPRPPGEGGAQRRVREVFDFSFTLNRRNFSSLRQEDAVPILVKLSSRESISKRRAGKAHRAHAPLTTILTRWRCFRNGISGKIIISGCPRGHKIVPTLAKTYTPSEKTSAGKDFRLTEPVTQITMVR